MDVVVWLRSLGLERYEAAFRENGVDETVLPKLTAEDVKDLGVTAVGHRTASYRSRPRLRSHPPTSMMGSFAGRNDDLGQWGGPDEMLATILAFGPSLAPV